MSRVHAFLPLALSLTLSLSAAGAECEWGRFRGPDGAGIASAKDAPSAWTEKDYLWKTALPAPGASSPVVCAGRLYVTSADPAAAMRTLVCLDAADGRMLWKREYPAEKFPQHHDNSYASSTPTADAAGVVVNWTTPAHVLLVALDRDGTEMWRRDLGPFVGLRGAGTSPVIYEDLVVLANDQEDPNQLPENRNRPDPIRPVGKSFLIALDRKTGETRWRIERETGIAAYSSPSVRRPAGGPAQLLFTSSPHGVTAVDPTAGRVVWELPGLFPDRCVASAVTAADLVFAGYGFGVKGTRFVAVRPGGPERKPEVAYDVSKTLPLVPTPLAKDGRVFLWGDDGVVACLRAADGETLWRERVGGSYYASPVCVDDRLFAVARNGEVAVVAAADKYALLGRSPLGEPSFATPAVAGGRIYFRTHTHVLALGGRGGAP